MPLQSLEHHYHLIDIMNQVTKTNDSISYGRSIYHSMIYIPKRKISEEEVNHYIQSYIATGRGSEWSPIGNIGNISSKINGP